MGDDFTLEPPEPPKQQTLKERFPGFDARHPIIWRLFKRFTFEMINAGVKRCSADMVLHRIRWQAQFDATGDMLNPDTGKPIKISNDWAAYYSRKFRDEFPQYRDFFRFRPLPNSGDDNAA